MIACLPMYERPENADAHDRFWTSIRTNPSLARHALPEALTRNADLWETWSATDLFLSQTCGLPYRTTLHDHVTLLGTADFGVSEKPGFYNSILVANRTDPRRTLPDFAGALLAVNDPVSQSGWAAPQAHMEALGLPLFDRVLLTGAHRASALAVAEGRAEVAAIDAITWRQIVQWDAFAEGLKVIDETGPTPGLPYIAASGTNAPETAAAMHQAIAELSAEDRARLGGIKDLIAIHPNAYLTLPDAPMFPQTG